jgi:Protein of unknown function (DUF1018)
MTDTPKKDLRQVKLAQLFAEAKKRGIEQDELRNIIAPSIIGHRLSEAKAGEVIEVIRHITGGTAEGFKPSPAAGSFKDRFSDLGYRDGMATPKQLRMIEAMWMDVSKMPTYAAREKALSGFLKRITGVENLRFVEDWMVQKIVKAIDHMKRR